MERLAELLGKSGLRKVLCFVLVLLTLTVLTAMDKVSGGELVRVLPWLFGPLVGGNVLEYYSRGKS